MKNRIFIYGIIGFVGLFSCSTPEPKDEGQKLSSNEEQTEKTVILSPGKIIFDRTCSACHMANGKGMPSVFPPLADSDWIQKESKENLIKQVLFGSNGGKTVNGVTYNTVMPAQQLSNEEIATVLNYVIEEWHGNKFTISPEEVAALK